jgi:hypothetical protein
LRPEQSGFIVLRIDGLGPPKAEISLTERAGIDGSLYNSGRAAPRNIVLGLRFYPGQNIEALRQQSYKFFPLNRPITFEVQATNRIAHATAYVEANEPDIFSKEEGCVITLVFPDSYLYDVVTSLTVFSSTIPKFEFPWSVEVTSGDPLMFQFPWSNESTDVPLLKMSELYIETMLEISELDMETTKNVIYEGDVPIGMLIHIHATGSASDFVLTDTVTLETLEIDSAKLVSTTGGDIQEGDDIWISTVKGNKYAILIRSVTTYNILNCLGISPVWFQLDRGDNVYAYSAASGLSNLQFEIFNDIAYEGI